MRGQTTIAKRAQIISLAGCNKKISSSHLQSSVDEQVYIYIETPLMRFTSQRYIYTHTAALSAPRKVWFVLVGSRQVVLTHSSAPGVLCVSVMRPLTNNFRRERQTHITMELSGLPLCKEVKSAVHRGMTLILRPRRGGSHTTTQWQGVSIALFALGRRQKVPYALILGSYDYSKLYLNN